LLNPNALQGQHGHQVPLAPRSGLGHKIVAFLQYSAEVAFPAFGGTGATEGGLSVGIKRKTRWNYCFIAALLLAGASQDVRAQQLPPANFSATVPTSKKRLVGFFASLNPDCSAIGEIDARVIRQPENGTVEIETGTGFTNYADNNQRHACNLKPSPGVRVNYTSKDGFIGRDAFEVEFLAGLGSDVVWKYTVTVK
jgi:hypothetical protein